MVLLIKQGCNNVWEALYWLIKFPSQLRKKKVTVNFLLAVAGQIPINLFRTELQPAQQHAKAIRNSHSGWFVNYSSISKNLSKSTFC